VQQKTAMFGAKIKTAAQTAEYLRLQQEALRQNKQAAAERKAAATAAAAAAIAAATDINALKAIIEAAKKRADTANEEIVMGRSERSVDSMKETQVPLLRRKTLSEEDKQIVDTAEVNIPKFFQEMKDIKQSAEDKARQVTGYLETSKTMTGSISAMRDIATSATSTAIEVESLPAEFEQKLEDFRAEIDKLTSLMAKYSAAPPATPPVETDYSKEDEKLVPIFVQPNENFSSVASNPQIGGFYDSSSPVGADPKARKPYTQYYDPKDYTIEFNKEKNVWIVKKTNGPGTSFEITPLDTSYQEIKDKDTPQIPLVDMSVVKLTQTGTSTTASTGNCSIYRAILLQANDSPSVKNGWYFNGRIYLRNEMVVSNPMFYLEAKGDKKAKYIHHAIFEVTDNTPTTRNVLPPVPVGTFTCDKVHLYVTTPPSYYDVFAYSKLHTGSPYFVDGLLNFVERVLGSKNIGDLKDILNAREGQLTEYTSVKDLGIEYLSMDDGLNKIAEIIQATTTDDFKKKLSVFVVPSTSSGVYIGCSLGSSGQKVKDIMETMYDEVVTKAAPGHKITLFPMTMMLSVNLGITAFMIENRPGANGIPFGQGFNNLRDVFTNPKSESGTKGNFTLRESFKNDGSNQLDYGKLNAKNNDNEFWKNNLTALIERSMISFMRIRKVQGGIKSELFKDDAPSKPATLSALIADATKLYNKLSSDSQKDNQKLDNYNAYDSSGILACNFAYCVGDLDVSEITTATLKNDDIMVTRYKVLLCMHLSQYLSVIVEALESTNYMDRVTDKPSTREINLYIPPLITNDDIRNDPTYQQIVSLALTSAVSVARNMYPKNKFVVKFLSNAADTDKIGYQILLPQPMKDSSVLDSDSDGGGISKPSTKNHKKTKKNNTKKSNSKSKKNKIKFL
jgi:hypothetical protein